MTKNQARKIQPSLDILTIEGVTVGEFDFAILRLQVEAYIFIGIITAIFPRPQF
ncbi:hypothetical protein AAKU67_004270 [Oxalobacteraceae bacterium GrIS 2.11]